MSFEMQSALIQCPYCWESIEVLVDCSVEQQEYTEDCSVCCHPIALNVTAEDGFLLEITARAEND